MPYPILACTLLHSTGMSTGINLFIVFVVVIGASVVQLASCSTGSRTSGSCEHKLGTHGETVLLNCDICSPNALVTFYDPEDGSLLQRERGKTEYRMEDVTASDGGRISCKCGADESTKMCFLVQVEPYITECSVKPGSGVHVGSDLTVTCTARTYPPIDQCSVGQGGGGSLQPHNTMHSKDNTTVTSVYFFSAVDEGQGEEYSCFAHNPDVGYASKSLSVTVYDRPIILDFKDLKYPISDNVSQALFECSVKGTSAVSVDVSFKKDGALLTEEGNKYRISCELTPGSKTVCLLRILSVGPSDEGRYLCVVGTEFLQVEDQKALEFSMPTPASTPTTETTAATTPTDISEKDYTTLIAALVTLGIVSAFIAVVVLLVCLKCCLNKNKKNKPPGTPGTPGTIDTPLSTPSVSTPSLGGNGELEAAQQGEPERTLASNPPPLRPHPSLKAKFQCKGFEYSDDDDDEDTEDDDTSSGRGVRKRKQTPASSP